MQDLDTNEYFVSQDVVFHENVFPFATKTQQIASLFAPAIDNVGLDLQNITMLRLGGVSEEVDDHIEQDQLSAERSDGESLGRGHHTKQPSVRLRCYVLHTMQKSSPSISTSTLRHTPSTTYPLAHFVNCQRFSM